MGTKTKRIVRSVAKNGDSNSRTEDQGDPALLDAAEAGNAADLNCLLNKGANINSHNNEFRTALMLAATKNHHECVELLLLACDTDRNRGDQNGWTALHVAVRKGLTTIAKELLDSGACPDVRAQTGLTPLMVAATKGDASMVTCLLERGADLSAVNNMGQTALHLAAIAGKSDAIMALNKFNTLSKIVNATDNNNHTALFYAAQNGHTEAARVLSEEFLATLGMMQNVSTTDDTDEFSDLSDDEDAYCPAVAPALAPTSPPFAFAIAAPPANGTHRVGKARSSRKRPLKEVEVPGCAELNPAELDTAFTAALCGNRAAFDRLRAAVHSPLARSYTALLMLTTSQYANETEGTTLAQHVLSWLKEPGQDSPHAQFVLAMFQYGGKVVQQDVQTAVNALYHLSRMGHANSQCALACHLDSTPGDCPWVKSCALSMYIRAAAQDHPEALFRLAVHFMTVSDSMTDHQALAVEYLERAAVRGHPAALQSLGDCYRHATGVPCDETQAIAHYQRSAEKNDADGAFCLGECYKFAIGTDLDVVEEARNFKKAADLGHAEACLYTGMHYFNGTGDFAQSDVDAWQYLRYASLHGHDEGTVAQAEYMLGMQALHGLGMPTDWRLAEEFLRVSTDRGHTVAQIELAFHLTFTVRTPESKAEARSLLPQLGADLPSVIAIPLSRGFVQLRCLTTTVSGKYVYGPDRDPQRANDQGELTNCVFAADAQWIQDASPVLKMGMLRLALTQRTALDEQRFASDLHDAQRLLKIPFHQTPRAAHCVCDQEEAFENARSALGSIDEIAATDKRIATFNTLRSVTVNLLF